MRSSDYHDGLRDGVTRFAWWRDGSQQVGTCGTTLKQAIADIEAETKHDKKINLDRLLEQMENHLLNIQEDTRIMKVETALDWIRGIRKNGMSEDQAS